MYIPSHFQETRTEVLQELIRAHSFGALVTLGADGLNATHIPFEFDPEPAPFGTLRAHVARKNPVWNDCSRDVAPLIVFQGAQTYISPSWYASKQETGRVVPTYNYMVVHAYGAMKVIDDPVWLRDLVTRLTDRFEATQAAPWKVTDAPDDYIEKILSAIIGIEIPIAKLIGSWKVSQNRSEADRAGVARGLRESGDADAAVMAHAVAQSGRS